LKETISLQELFKILKKRIVLIFSILVMSVMITGVVSYFFLSPTYEVSTQILINQKEQEQNQFNTQDIETNLQLINTYNVIIKSPVILSKVIDNLELNTTTELLYEKIEVNSEQNSQVINVSVQDPNSIRAVDIANMTAEVLQNEIQTLMNVDNITVISPAVNKKNIKPVSPNIPLNLVIAIVIGLMIGVGITLLKVHLDTSIKTEQDVNDILELSVLGLVSPITQKKSIGSKELKSLRKQRRHKSV
jgi:capsular polysaccharide biosynthesis protein